MWLKSVAPVGSCGILTGSSGKVFGGVALCTARLGKPYGVPWVVGMGLMCMGNERTAGSLPPRGQRGVWHKIRPRPNRAKPCLQRRESSVRFILCFILMDASLAMKLISAVIYFKSIYWASIVSGRSPRGGNGNPRKVFLPGKSPRQRSLVGYSPWGGKESDVTELTIVCWALCLEL